MPPIIDTSQYAFKTQAEKNALNNKKVEFNQEQTQTQKENAFRDAFIAPPVTPTTSTFSPTIPTITPESIGTSPIKTPTITPQLRPSPSLDTFVQDAKQYITKTDTEIQLEREQAKTISELSNAPRRADIRANLEGSLDIQTKRDKVSKYSSRLEQLNAEFENVKSQIERQQEGTSSLQGFLDARTNAIKNKINEERRLAAADLTFSQGDLSSALDQVNQSIDDTFADRKDQIDLRQAWITSLEQSLAREDSRNKDVLNLALSKQKEVYNQEMFQLEQDQQETKDIRILSLNALANGADDLVIKKMREAKTVEDAIMVGGRYVLDPLEQAKLVSEKALTASRNRSNLPNPRQNKQLNVLDITRLQKAGYEVVIGDTMEDVAERNNTTLEDVNISVSSTENSIDTLNPVVGQQDTWESRGGLLGVIKDSLFDSPTRSSTSRDELEAEFDSLNL